jgi:hypothetical protein
MATKLINKVEVKHILVNDTLDVVNRLVADYINDGWDLLTMHFYKYDSYNNMFIAVYVFKRGKPEQV